MIVADVIGMERHRLVNNAQIRQRDRLKEQ